MTDTTPAEVTEPAPSTETTEAPITGQTAEAERTVHLGDHVLYVLSEGDAKAIDAADPARGHRNPVSAGQEYPAVVTAVWTPPTVNLRVFLDGAGHGADYWATSRTHGTNAGQWHA